jgi:hypothetical protein
MIEPVAICDERVGQRTEVKQLIPVCVVAGQTRHFDAEDDPHLAQAHIGDEVLEAFPCAQLGARASEVVVDDDNLAR